MSKEPNEELFNAYVNEEFRQAADNTQKKVEEKINGYISEFRSNLDEIAKDVESKDFTKQFKTEADAVLKNVLDANKELEVINKITKELEGMDTDFQEKLNKLNQANAALKTKLDGIHEKATSFGSTAGKVIASGIKQSIMGLPIF